jgi:glutamine amidotransferase PdxT
MDNNKELYTDIQLEELNETESIQVSGGESTVVILVRNINEFFTNLFEFDF